MSRCAVSIYVMRIIRQHQCDGGTRSPNTWFMIYSRDRPSCVCFSISISYLPMTRLHVVQRTESDIFFFMRAGHITDMSYIEKPEYARYASAMHNQTPGLAPAIGQGCKNTSVSGYRAFTSYAPSCTLNGYYRDVLAPAVSGQQQRPNDYGQTPTNRQYRHFLQQNAVGIMQMNRGEAAYMANATCFLQDRQPLQTANVLFNRNEYPRFSK